VRKELKEASTDPVGKVIYDCGGCYMKPNKLGTERQILHDVTYI
jgi:hypothetical protein